MTHNKDSRTSSGFFSSSEISEEEQKRIMILSALSSTISKKIRDAVAYRASSGIETEWQGDEEFYQGFDDHNRDEFANNVSGRSSLNPENSKPVKKSDGSTVFPNITQPYVDAASARISDMLMPTDDRNFVIEHGTIPELGSIEEEVKNVKMPDGSVVDASMAKDAMDAIKKEASMRAGKAQDRIDDWLTECQFHSEMRNAIDDSAKIGTGIIKGPIPKSKTKTKWVTKDGLSQLEILTEIKPVSVRIDPWNFFPDYPACGEDIRRGSFVAECDEITEKKLIELKEDPGYIASQIDACIEEGAKSNNVHTKNNNKAATITNYTIWYYYGQIKAEEMMAAGCDCGTDKKHINAMITMVDDRVIKASLNHLENGDFPYDLIPFKRRAGMPWGVGVARQMRTPQRIVVASTRALMDNAGASSKPHKVTSTAIVPTEDRWTWEVDVDADIQDVRAAMTFFVQPSMQAELMNIIQFGMKMAEDVTGMPMLMQGQQGNAPETVGGMQILNNNANSVLRRVARLFDTCITEPHVRRYYDWLMEHGKEEEEKGDFNIVARGSSALVERDIQSQEMVNILQLCLNPAFKKNPERAMDEYLKSRRFDPEAFSYTEEELKKLSEQQAPPAPQVQAAQIREQGASQRKQMELQAAQQENALDRQIDKMKIEIDGQLGAANLSVEERMALNDAKVTLSGLAMKLNVQKDLSLSDKVSDLHKYHNPQIMTPPTEPKGRASPGEAFAQ